MFIDNWIAYIKCLENLELDVPPELLKVKDKQPVRAFHDKLDAFVAWQLGTSWANNGKPQVMILGDVKTGSFLVPENDQLRVSFQRFIANQA